MVALGMISIANAAGGLLSPGEGGLLTPLYVNFTKDGTGIVPFNNLNIGSPTQPVPNGYFGNITVTNSSTTLPTVSGIGTSSPYATFSIQTNASAYNPNVFTIASTTSSGTGTSTLFNVAASGNVSIATSSQASELNIGPRTSTGSSTVSEGKIQFDGYNDAGVRVCMFLNASNALAVSAGACNP